MLAVKFTHKKVFAVTHTKKIIIHCILWVILQTYFWINEFTIECAIEDANKLLFHNS